MIFKIMFLFLTFGFIVTSLYYELNLVAVKEAKVIHRIPVAVINPVIPKVVKVAEYSTEILFVKGAESVPSLAKAEIKRMFQAAKRVGRIQSAKIISWADQLRSPQKKSSLSSAQLKLVEDRNDNLEAYLERLDLQMNVNKISMAEKPEVMDSLLTKDDRKLKSHLELNDFASASKSIVLFVLKKARK
jgi:hypothetical protein